MEADGLLFVLLISPEVVFRDNSKRIPPVSKAMHELLTDKMAISRLCKRLAIVVMTNPDRAM